MPLCGLIVCETNNIRNSFETNLLTGVSSGAAVQSATNPSARAPCQSLATRISRLLALSRTWFASPPLLLRPPCMVGIQIQYRNHHRPTKVLAKVRIHKHQSPTSPTYTSRTRCGKLLTVHTKKSKAQKRAFPELNLPSSCGQPRARARALLRNFPRIIILWVNSSLHGIPIFRGKQLHPFPQKIFPSLLQTTSSAAATIRILLGINLLL